MKGNGYGKERDRWGIGGKGGGIGEGADKRKSAAK